MASGGPHGLRVPRSRDDMTAPKDWFDSSDQRAMFDRADPMLIDDPTDNAEANEPMLPIDPNDPTLAIDSVEPSDAIDRHEFFDHNDRRDMVAILPPWRSSGESLGNARARDPGSVLGCLRLRQRADCVAERMSSSSARVRGRTRHPGEESTALWS